VAGERRLWIIRPLLCVPADMAGPAAPPPRTAGGERRGGAHGWRMRLDLLGGLLAGAGPGDTGQSRPWRHDDARCISHRRRPPPDARPCGASGARCWLSAVRAPRQAASEQSYPLPERAVRAFGSTRHRSIPGRKPPGPAGGRTVRRRPARDRCCHVPAASGRCQTWRTRPSGRSAM